LDGADQTARAQITATGLTLTPPAPLADGSHTVALSLRDFARNLAQATWSFTVDTTPPVLTITAPTTAVVDSTSPTLGVAYSDATSGVDLPSLQPGGSFTATQTYYYNCPCSGDQTFATYTITRSVVQKPDGTWKYVVTKDGSSAMADPLP
jgi:hypothetical protein